MTITVYNNENVIEWGVTDGDRIAQNVRNLLRTKQFEVPFMGDMGLNADYVDGSIRQIKTSITNDVIELIKIYEPRAEVLEVNIESFDENGNYIIAVKLEV